MPIGDTLGGILSAASYFTIALGVLGFVLQGVLLAVAGTWKLTRIEKAILETVITHRKEIDSDIDARDRNVGESLQGIRQKIADVDQSAVKKITEVELYVRDTFVRRDSWHQAMNQMHERWAAGEKTAEERDLRIEAKVDRIIERLMGEK
jgi:hypothetical protein